MTIMLALIALLISIVCLWLAGEHTITATQTLAKHYRLTTGFVGFVLLAIVANIPELAVAIMAALQGASQVSAGDIIGANFTDVALASGLTLACAKNFIIEPSNKKELIATLVIACSIMIIVMLIGTLKPIHGACLLASYLIFIMWSWYNQNRPTQITESNTIKKNTFKLWLYFIGSTACVLICSAMVIHSSLIVATSCGLPLTTIGATFVAIGTTLPEITISISALRRQEYILALGPTLGTILAQATLALGSLALLSEHPITLHTIYDAAIFMFIAFIILLYGLIRNKMLKPTGIILLLLFGLYIIYHCNNCIV